MSDNLTIYLLDNSNNITEDISIKRPNSYEDLLKIINPKIKSFYSNYLIFYRSMDDKEIIIDNKDAYETIKDIDIIFARENKAEQSVFTMNYNKLSESKQEIIDEKYNCYICDSNIKNENPYFCYICQKNFHEKCLKDWEKKRSEANEVLNCPNCRNELELKDWKKKIRFQR